jgi:uncharacterized protein (TIGR03437 family)
VKLQRSASVAAFGGEFSATTIIAPGPGLPTRLGGTTVTVKDSKGVERLSPLFFVSPNQVNYQMPLGTAAGTALIAVQSGTGAAFVVEARIAPIAPGLFRANTNGKGPPAGFALRVYPDNRQTLESLAQFDSATNQFIPATIRRPISGGSPERIFLVFFGVGIRPQPGAVVKLHTGVSDFDAAYAGPQGDFIGLDQLNFELSPITSLTPGIYNLSITVNGRESNPVQIRIVD